jgi:dipeptidyl aminopeptidase/acylaminoacyl peptidase
MGLEQHALGELHGDWAFVARRLLSGSAGGFIQIWAVKLDGSDAKLALSVRSDYSGPRQDGAGAFVIRRQLSPDWRGIVLPVSMPDPEPRFGSDVPLGRLAVFDLFAGTYSVIPLPASPLGDDELRPAWSPDGKWIAYDRQLRGGFQIDGIWRVHPDGSAPEKVCGAYAIAQNNQGAFDGCSGVDGWTPEGRIAFTEGGHGYSTFDQIGTFLIRWGEFATSEAAVSWRTDLYPPVVATFTDHTVRPEEQRLVVSDPRGSDRRVLLRYPPGSTELHEPRWNPITSDILVRTTRAGGDAKLMIVLIDGRIAADIGVGRPVRGEWSSDGSQIVYLEGALAANGVTGTVRIADARTGGADRIVWSPPADGGGWQSVDLMPVRFR